MSEVIISAPQLSQEEENARWQKTLADIKRGKKNGERVQREVVIMIKALDKCGKLPENLEWQIDYEWDDLLNKVDDLLCKFVEKWELKFPY